MSDKSEGYRGSKTIKILPQLRGEVWMTWDNRKVIVLQKLRNGAVECLNSKGTTEVLWGSEFKRRIADVQVSDVSEQVENGLDARPKK